MYACTASGAEQYAPVDATVKQVINNKARSQCNLIYVSGEGCSSWQKAAFLCLVGLGMLAQAEALQHAEGTEQHCQLPFAPFGFFKSSVGYGGNLAEREAQGVPAVGGDGLSSKWSALPPSFPSSLLRTPRQCEAQPRALPSPALTGGAGAASPRPLLTWGSRGRVLLCPWTVCLFQLLLRTKVDLRKDVVHQQLLF